MSPQILIAQGEHFDAPFETPVRKSGHAIRCRINTENPGTFMPFPGRITGLNPPDGIGIRVDTAVYTDLIVPPH